MSATWRAKRGHRRTTRTNAAVARYSAIPLPRPAAAATPGATRGDSGARPVARAAMPAAPSTAPIVTHTDVRPVATRRQPTNTASAPAMAIAVITTSPRPSATSVHGRNLIFAATSAVNAVITAR